MRAGHALVATARRHDLHLRVGAHLGEVEVRGGDVTGINVNIAARITALAGPDQVLVSRTIRDLVAGSGLHFESLGPRELRGVDGSRELFAAV